MENSSSQIVKNLLNILYWCGIFACGLWGTSYAMGTVHPVIVVLMVAGLSVSIYKSVKGDDYIKRTLAIPKNDRSPVFDYVRFVAIIFIFIAHVVGSDLSVSGELAGTPLYGTLDYIRWISVCTNVLFIMLSGALLLPYKKESILHFYFRRMARILVPFVIYYMWYVWMAEGVGTSSVLDIIKRMISGDIASIGADHFWLLYRILQMYLVIYFIRLLVKNLSYRALTIISGVILLALTACLFLPIETRYSIEFFCWCSVTIVGYWCAREETRGYDNWLLVVGVAGLIMLYASLNYLADSTAALSNLSPIRLLIGVGIFALFFKLKPFIKNVWFIRLISKYSYSLLLIHYWAVIKRFSVSLWGISSVMYKGLGTLISIGVCLLVSLVAAYLIDNLIVVTFDTIISKVKVDD
ncbi:MAG: acyltransferase [Pseudobutyrivibrio sp.]|nr:acyltransferase [Pseudobutyrivibrio sp.]